jgi:acyl carrier protein
VAANVIHAARSLDAALERAQRLLAPGGVLVLLETTVHQPWFDMSVGLIEGWQHFADAGRAEHPLLEPEQWEAAFGRAGFQDAVVLPGAESPAYGLGQHVLLARAPTAKRNASQTEVSAAPTIKAAEAVTPVDRGTVMENALGELSPELREEAVARIARETICDVFRLEVAPEELGDRDRLTDLGMDSLIALELRTELAKRLGLEGKIPSTIGFDTGTLGELVKRLGQLVTPEAEVPVTAAESPRPAIVAAKQVSIEELEAMSDEDVELLLKERLSRA